MRKYEWKEKKKLLRVVCNGCGRELDVKNGYLREECFHGEHVPGYFSEADGTRAAFDLCGACYRKLTERFAVPVEQDEEVELL